ncbi:glutamate racemase [Sungkyunkwania multivorans]|uniref:Glutamate racemase n=1 Tax=Sungkyunkwania multivorans TaxID=1173618 RepID=A0ABW3D0S9_9FLAO
MTNTNPIGFFDSGVGGISIWNEVNTLLPNESSIYLADSANAPYGPKGKDKIIALSIKNTELLLEHHCKLIVVACNTATTNAIDHLRATYDVPFIGIEPAIKPAALQTVTNAVGILATEGTLSSELFYKTSALFASDVSVVEQIGTGLVELIEAGKIDTEEMEMLLKKYTAPMIKANIDHLVLGCSHYPYLIPKLRALLPESVKIIDSGEAVARQTKAILTKNGLLNTEEEKAEHSFYTNTNAHLLQGFLNDDHIAAKLDF